MNMNEQALSVSVCGISAEYNLVIIHHHHCVKGIFNAA